MQSLRQARLAETHTSFGYGKLRIRHSHANFVSRGTNTGLAVETESPNKLGFPDEAPEATPSPISNSHDVAAPNDPTLLQRLTSSSAHRRGSRLIAWSRVRSHCNAPPVLMSNSSTRSALSGKTVCETILSARRIVVVCPARRGTQLICEGRRRAVAQSGQMRALRRGAKGGYRGQCWSRTRRLHRTS